MSRGHPNNFVSSVGISLSKYQALRSGRLMKLLVSLSRHRCILFCTISFFLAMIVLSRMQLYFASHEYATHRELLVETFQLHDESTGEKALHPSKPFFVMEDESSGKILLSLDDKELGHPLNRLADLRSPREEGRETVFFFHVPKVSTGKLLSFFVIWSYLRINYFILLYDSLMILFHMVFLKGSRKDNQEYSDELFQSSTSRKN